MSENKRRSEIATKKEEGKERERAGEKIPLARPRLELLETQCKLLISRRFMCSCSCCQMVLSTADKFYGSVGRIRVALINNTAAGAMQ